MNKELLFGISVPLTGAGVVLLALMPLALPILVLTIVATVPRLVVGLVVALVLGVVAAPVIVVRRLLQHHGNGPTGGAQSSTTRYSENRWRSRIPRAS
jgi:hypothetical protein